jgi:hypothetical protein
LQSYLRAGGAITFPDIENEVDRATLFIGKCYNFCELCVQITLSMRRSILNQRYEKVKSLNIGFLLSSLVIGSFNRTTQAIKGNMSD